VRLNAGRLGQSNGCDRIFRSIESATLVAQGVAATFGHCAGGFFNSFIPGGLE